MDLNLSIPTSASRRTRLRCRRCASLAEGGSSPRQRGNQARTLAALLLTIEWKRKSAGLNAGCSNVAKAATSVSRPLRTLGGQKQ